MPKASKGSLNQPISHVQWVGVSKLKANAYNPNKVFGPEWELLKISLLENGWTAPVTVTQNMEIIDGFHRWTLCCKDKDVYRLTQGKVPVVVLQADTATRMMATIRMNRARGQHGILKMAEILRTLTKQGLSRKALQTRLQMEPEEVDRLLDHRGSPEKAGQDSFGKGWVPAGKTGSQTGKPRA